MKRFTIWNGMLVLLLAAIVSSAAGLRGGSQEAGDAEDPLDALIDKTNELEAFAATYRLVGPDKEMTLRLLYSATLGAVVHMEDDEGSMMHSAALDGTIYAQVRGEDGEPFGQAIQMKRVIAAIAPLRENECREFPGFEESEDDRRNIGEGAFFQLRFSAAENETINGNYTVGYEEHREFLCYWLPWLQEAQPLPGEDESLLRYETDDGLLAELSAETGFLQRVWRKDIGPDVRAMILESLDLDPELADDEFDPPEALIGSAGEVSDWEQRLTAQMIEGYRASLYAFLDTHLASGELEWNEDTRDRCTRVFQPYVELVYAESMAVFREALEANLTEWASRLQAHAEEIRGEEGAAERIRENANDCWEAVEQQLEASRQIIEKLELPLAEEEWSDLATMVLELERAVQRSLFDELAGDPIRAHHGKLVEEILESLEDTP